MPLLGHLYLPAPQSHCDTAPAFCTMSAREQPSVTSTRLPPPQTTALTPPPPPDLPSTPGIALGLLHTCPHPPPLPRTRTRTRTPCPQWAPRDSVECLQAPEGVDAEADAKADDEAEATPLCSLCDVHVLASSLSAEAVAVRFGALSALPTLRNWTFEACPMLPALELVPETAEWQALKLQLTQELDWSLEREINDHAHGSIPLISLPPSLQYPSPPPPPRICSPPPMSIPCPSHPPPPWAGTITWRQSPPPPGLEGDLGGGVQGPIKTPQMDYMSHRGITHARRGPPCTRKGQKVLLYKWQPMNYRQGSSGTRHGRGAGRSASGYGGRSMQKAVLRSPSTISRKELLGLAVSMLAPLWSLCASATPGRAQALAPKRAAVLGMGPARRREPGTAVIESTCWGPPDRA